MQLQILWPRQVAQQTVCCHRNITMTTLTRGNENKQPGNKISCVCHLFGWKCLIKKRQAEQELVHFHCVFLLCLCHSLLAASCRVRNNVLFLLHFRMEMWLHSHFHSLCFSSFLENDLVLWSESNRNLGSAEASRLLNAVSFDCCFLCCHNIPCLLQSGQCQSTAALGKKKKKVLPDDLFSFEKYDSVRKSTVSLSSAALRTESETSDISSSLKFKSFSWTQRMKPRGGHHSDSNTDVVKERAIYYFAHGAWKISTLLTSIWPQKKTKKADTIVCSNSEGYGGLPSTFTYFIGFQRLKNTLTFTYWIKGNPFRRNATCIFLSEITGLH